MLNNILKLKIKENEKVYTEGKTALENIIAQGNSEYSKLLNEYRTKAENIKNDSMLSESGKTEQGTKLHNDYLQKVKDAAVKYIKQLQDKNISIIKSIEIEKEKNNEMLDGQKVPQIIYVSCMMNSINSLQDAPMLKEVFEYACLEDNFSSEVMNLIYLKANSLLNALNQYPTKIADETQSAVQERVLNQESILNKNMSDGMFRTSLQAILTEINKYRHDYITEFKRFEDKFKYWLARGEYPKNLIYASEVKRDFAIDPKLDKNNPWNKSIDNSWGGTFTNNRR